MSMNLHCNKVDLWQTPTWVTYLCMSLDDEGNPDGGMEGVRRRYIMWVKSTLNGVWNSTEDFEGHRASVEDHLRELNSHKDLEFYIL